MCPINITEIVITHPLICPIGGHQHHGIVFLFHSKDMKSDIFNLIEQCIHGTQCLVGEVIFDLVTTDIARLIPPLLDERGSIDTLLYYIHQNPKDTEIRIQHNNLTHDTKLLGEAKH